MIYNTKIIDYGDYYHIEWFDKHIIRKDEDEKTKELLQKANKQEILEDCQPDYIDYKDPKKEEHSLQTSVNRSKNKLFRIARSNKDWEYFITLTFDRTKNDSSDYSVVSNILSRYCDKIRRKNPDFKYLFVPEFHKDNLHYHFHGLVAHCDLDLIDSGHKDQDGNVIYNIPYWSEMYGFNYVQEIKDQSAVRNYIGKYITKELMNRLKYKKRYYASDNCNVADEDLREMTIDDIYQLYADKITHARTITVDHVNRIKYFEVKKD